MIIVYEKYESLVLGELMSRFKEYGFVWSLGALLYGLIEILWRGYTHYSMVLTGGVCFLIIYKISELDRNIVVKSIMGALAITAVEFAVGVTVNIIFKLEVWDYSRVPLNVLGQICPIYTVLWFLLCLMGVPLCAHLRKSFFTVSSHT